MEQANTTAPVISGKSVSKTNLSPSLSLPLSFFPHYVAQAGLKFSKSSYHIHLLKFLFTVLGEGRRIEPLLFLL